MRAINKSPFAWLLLVGLGLLCFGPFVLLFQKGLTLPEADQANWQFIRQSLLPGLIGNTVALILASGIGSAFLGTLSATLVTLTNLPGRRWFNFLFILPISFPLYLISYIYVGAFEYSGTIPTWGRAIGLPFSPSIKNFWGLSFVFTLALSPYVYLLARSAFLKMGPKMLMASRSLGLSPRQTYFKVVLPYALPWIFAGASLAMMEALADFGGVSLFQYNTFTTAIYTSWFSLFSLSSAARLSCFLIVFALVLYSVESMIVARGRHTSLGSSPLTGPLFSFSRKGQFLLFSLAMLIVFSGVLFPALQLLLWLPVGLKKESLMLTLNLSGQTILLALLASTFTLSLGLALIYIKKVIPSRLSSALTNLSLLGYALPGTLIAVAVFLFFQFFHLSLGQSFLLLLTGLAIRFLTISYRPLLAGLRGIHPNYERAARNLGCSSAQTLKHITLPLLAPSVLVSFMLLFIEVIKEMPITLMLRPFGFSTLSTRLFELTAEGEWERASLSGLGIFLIGLLGPWLLSRLGDRL